MYFTENFGYTNVIVIRLSLITVPIHEGEARVRGQLAYDNPDVAMVLVFYTIGK